MTCRKLWQRLFCCGFFTQSCQLTCTPKKDLKIRDREDLGYDIQGKVNDITGIMAQEDADIMAEVGAEKDADIMAEVGAEKDADIMAEVGAQEVNQEVANVMVIEAGGWRRHV